jgi:hypothetical protein
MEKDDRGKKTKRPLYSRRTTSTAFQLAVDHAFTGSYAKRFRPADPVTFFFTYHCAHNGLSLGPSPYFVIYSYHAQTMTHTPPIAD